MIKPPRKFQDYIDDACDPEITGPILYTARNGKSSLGEDEDRIYLFRNTRATNLTGVTNDYVDKSKSRNNTNALVGHALRRNTQIGVILPKGVSCE